MLKDIRDIVLNTVQLPFICMFYLGMKIYDIYYYFRLKI